ncbi:MAG: methionyl-tRNA formyltransferase [Deltaproteobacteria bacterium]|nr:methionyl-tRNA formyltransferase [Deltaproteobacteria bacterium]
MTDKPIDKWRIVFMGTPDFACPALAALIDSGEEVLAVVTQPDRGQGRGRKPAPPPVKVLAEDRGIPVWQPEKIRTPEFTARIKDLEPHLFVVVAYGNILSPALLDIPQKGSLNVHASLLPAYRGPAPINWAIINGETQTGVTTMFQDRGVDTGPILLSKSTRIDTTDSCGTLHDRLADLGARLLVETIAGLKAGTVSPRPQPEQGISYAPLLKKSDGLVDWTRPAKELDCLVRGVDPWPGAHTTFRGKTLKLFGSRTGTVRGKAGQVMGLENGRLHVAAGEGSLVLAELQLAGQKRLPAASFWHGQRLELDDMFGT